MGNECVPDGSVICEQGTRFDMATGTCVVDPSACADGTVLVSGECVPEDETLTADHDEAAEPNDEAGAGEFDVPALNADVTIHGCISPRAGVRDEDIWVMTASAPTLIEVTADGVGGLAAGFIIQDNGIASLPNYFRAGLNLTGDTSKRQVYLPAAGVYLLVMDDSRAILVDEVAGGADTCYYTTIKTVAMPAATTLTTPTQTGEDSGNVRVLTYTSTADAEILQATLTTTSESLSPGFVIMRNNAPTGVGAPITNTTTGAVQPPSSFQGLGTAEVVTVVVDHQYNFSPNPTPYTITSSVLAPQALPTAGGNVAVTTRRAGADGTTDPTKMNYLYFDVPTAGALVQFAVTSTTAVDMVVLRQNLGLYAATGFSFSKQGIANDFGATGATSVAAFDRFLTAGRYYLAVQNPSTAGAVVPGATITITSTLTPITPTALTYGTAVTAQALPASFASFHTIDLTNPTWVEFAATGTNWGTNINVNLYDLAGEGFVGSTAYPAAIATSKIANGTDPAGRIMIGDTRDFLVRVTPSTVPGASPTYDLNIRTRPHVALGAITPGTPINRTADAIAAGSDAAGAQSVTRYLVTGLSWGRVSLAVTPAAAQSSNINIRWRNADESVNGPVVDAGGDGAVETINASFGALPANWAAFTVGSSDTEASTVDVVTTSLDPQYASQSTALTFTDACTNGGAVVAMTAPNAGLIGDEEQTALINLPSGWSFPFFGAAQTQFYINSNGFLGFGTLPPCTGSGSFCSFANGAALNANDLNGWVAPYWDDMLDVTVCRKDNATNNTMTIQWTGLAIAGDVQVQAILHMTGRIEFVYGPDHTASGLQATAGVENLTGTAAYQSVFNAASITPGSGRFFMPQ
ncbi:MAG TPA: hypothetical protein VM261_22470 [Kofleriaceae bacterium]|nr:hypothetical protein [Kofleriaceae bacterium]